MSETTMDRELVKEWVAALRSGKYQQGRFKLRTLDDTYCCLGVAYDIATDGKGWVEAVGWVTSEGGNRTQLPFNLNLRLGLSRISDARLMRMNDSGATFTDIADWIETNILGGAE